MEHINLYLKVYDWHKCVEAANTIIKFKDSWKLRGSFTVVESLASSVSYSLTSTYACMYE